MENSTKHEHQCCCTCINQKVVLKHPTNITELSQGAMSEEMGYVCLLPTEFESDAVVFFDNKHGLCEMYLTKIK